MLILSRKFGFLFAFTAIFAIFIVAAVALARSESAGSQAGITVTVTALGPKFTPAPDFLLYGRRGQRRGAEKSCVAPTTLGIFLGKFSQRSRAGLTSAAPTALV